MLHFLAYYLLPSIVCVSRHRDMCSIYPVSRQCTAKQFASPRDQINELYMKDCEHKSGRNYDITLFSGVHES